MLLTNSTRFALLTSVALGTVLLCSPADAARRVSRTPVTYYTPAPAVKPTVKRVEVRTPPTMQEQIVGSWSIDLTDGDIATYSVFHFGKDGTYFFKHEVYRANQPGSQPLQRNSVGGTWRPDGNEIIIDTEVGRMTLHPQIVDGRLKLTFPEIVITLDRVQ